jgi:hypothetical protein
MNAASNSESGGTTLADAIVGRIVLRAHRIDLKGPSLPHHLTSLYFYSAHFTGFERSRRAGIKTPKGCRPPAGRSSGIWAAQRPRGRRR